MDGLSPLARGTLQQYDPFKAARRFIPAGAGNTKPGARRRGDVPVYPRWRGEHPRIIVNANMFCGLSPLARGTLRTVPAPVRRGRFIPAGAGNTKTGVTAFPRIPVYPRWRGEHGRWSNSQSEQSGLSPLARGTPRINTPSQCPARFIPAGAGNTPPSPRLRILVTVYPRWRGEHARGHAHNLRESGLSPLARGTRDSNQSNARRQRFIPAGAGNTHISQ